MNEKIPPRSFYLLVFSISYFAIVIASHIVFGMHLRPNELVSLPDIIDLVFYPPIIGVLLYLLYDSTVSKSASMYEKILYLIFLILHIEGHGIHWSGNALDVLIEREGISGLVYDFAYFIDEIFSHLIMFSSLFIIMVLLIIYEEKYDALDASEYYRYPLISGMIMGFNLLVASIEAQVPYEAISVALILVALPIYFAKRKRRSLKEKQAQLFSLVVGAAILLLSPIYYVMFGGFIQPSEIF